MGKKSRFPLELNEMPNEDETVDARLPLSVMSSIFHTQETTLFLDMVLLN
ncbi:hypothetical protein [Ligilactobacillus ruminis]|nr:hypothetical protein [Ligilactobacillus ruminis]